MRVTVGMVVAALAIGGIILYLNNNPKIQEEVCDDVKRFKKNTAKNLQNMM